MAQNVTINKNQVRLAIEFIQHLNRRIDKHNENNDKEKARELMIERIGFENALCLFGINYDAAYEG